MKQKLLLVLFCILPATVICQKSFTVNEKYERVKLGYTAYDLDYNNDYCFMMEDIAPGSAAIGAAPVWLLAFDKKTNAITKGKIEFKNKKDAFVGSVAVGSDIILCYEGKNKETKKNGFYCEKHKSTGELISALGFWQTESKENRDFDIHVSANKQFFAIRSEKELKVLNAEMKVVYENISIPKNLQNVLALNNGSVILEYFDGAKVDASLISPDGKKTDKISYNLPGACYSYYSKIDNAKNQLSVAKILRDTLSKEVITTALQLEVFDLSTLKSAYSVKQSVSSTDKAYDLTDIFIIDEVTYLVSQESANQSRSAIAPANAHDANSPMKNYVKLTADEILILKVKEQKAETLKSIKRHVATDGNFMWLLSPYIFKAKDKTYISFYDLGNVSIGAYNYKVKFAQLDDKLNLIGTRETDTGDIGLTINHTRPMQLTTDKFAFTGWKASGKVMPKLDIGSAILIF